MTPVVVYQMEQRAQRERGGYEFQKKFYRENKDGGSDTYIPFELALEHKRWASALAIYRHRHQLSGVVPEADDESEMPEHRRSSGPGLRDTREKKALDYLLVELDRLRPDRNLAPGLAQGVQDMIRDVADQEGADTTLLRVLAHQPRWLNEVPMLLEKGARPDAYAVNRTGQTMQALTTAGLRGAERAFFTLLEAGANPLWRHHDGDSVIHRLVDLSVFSERRDGAVDLDHVQARLRCAQMLLDFDPAVGESRGSYDRTVEQARQAGLEWLSRQSAPGDCKADEAAAWQARKMDILMPAAGPARKGPRM